MNKFKVDYIDNPLEYEYSNDSFVVECDDYAIDDETILFIKNRQVILTCNNWCNIEQM